MQQKLSLSERRRVGGAGCGDPVGLLFFLLREGFGVAPGAPVSSQRQGVPQPLFPIILVGTGFRDSNDEFGAVNSHRQCCKCSTLKTNTMF